LEVGLGRELSALQSYNHYSLLRSIEDIFGVGHLGYAADPEVTPFGRDVFGAR
jgi:hypothetical protein